jgi:hypothetical protein
VCWACAWVVRHGACKGWRGWLMTPAPCVACLVPGEGEAGAGAGASSKASARPSARSPAGGEAAGGGSDGAGGAGSSGGITSQVAAPVPKSAEILRLDNMSKKMQLTRAGSIATRRVVTDLLQKTKWVVAWVLWRGCWASGFVGHTAGSGGGGGGGVGLGAGMIDWWEWGVGESTVPATVATNVSDAACTLCFFWWPFLHSGFPAWNLRRSAWTLRCSPRQTAS